MYVSSSYVHSFILPQNVVAKKEYKKTELNKTRMNTTVHCLCSSYSTYSQHYTVDYYKHEIHLRTSFLVWNKITLGRSKPKWSWQHLTTSILLALNNFINRRITKNNIRMTGIGLCVTCFAIVDCSFFLIFFTCLYSLK